MNDAVLQRVDGYAWGFTAAAAVAGGVPGDAAGLVVAGSLVLLGALVGFAVGAGPLQSRAVA